MLRRWVGRIAVDQFRVGQGVGGAVEAGGGPNGQGEGQVFQVETARVKDCHFAGNGVSLRKNAHQFARRQFAAFQGVGVFAALLVKAGGDAAVVNEAVCAVGIHAP